MEFGSIGVELIPFSDFVKFELQRAVGRKAGAFDDFAEPPDSSLDFDLTVPSGITFFEHKFEFVFTLVNHLRAHYAGGRTPSDYLKFIGGVDSVAIISSLPKFSARAVLKGSTPAEFLVGTYAERFDVYVDSSCPRNEFFVVNPSGLTTRGRLLPDRRWLDG